ncbi:MAG: hypothetical protein EBS30_00745 [Planctomycetes bacterium]|nr:hypothetical protein [Planctomycetota bacterium]
MLNQRRPAIFDQTGIIFLFLAKENLKRFGRTLNVVGPASRRSSSKTASAIVFFVTFQPYAAK